MLLVKDVEKSYGSFCVLKNINIEFNKGVYGLLAPNGAGKTTLIKMLTTLLFPSKGEILYHGEDIIKLDEEYRNILGYLPQTFGYYRNYSARQYLMYLAALKGIERKAAKERTARLLKLVGLEEVMDKKLKKYSGGMIQRVGIAQAMLNDPKILILDEPTAGLDPKERARFRNLISELAIDRTVILSTHIVSDVESIANEIILLKDQRILHHDSVEKICSLVEGMVYETQMPYSDVPAFRKGYLSLAEKQEGGKMKIRFISRERLQAQWKPVAPGLEDVFLYIYQDQNPEEGAQDDYHHQRI